LSYGVALCLVRPIIWRLQKENLNPM